MRIIRTADLEAAYAEAPEAVQRSFKRCIAFLARDFRHPSLRTARWPDDGPDCYYARLTLGWRFYYQRQGDTAVVYWMQKRPLSSAQFVRPGDARRESLRERAHGDALTGRVRRGVHQPAMV